MDPAIVPEEPTVKEATGRRFLWFKKDHWSRSDIETYIDGRWPQHVKATWFDQGDIHKVVVDLPKGVK